MQGENFVMQGTERTPSIFEGMLLLFTAFIGRYLIGYIMLPINWGISYFVFDVSESFSTGFTQTAYFLVFIVFPISLTRSLHPDLNRYMRVKTLSDGMTGLSVLAGLLLAAVCVVIGALWENALLTWGAVQTASGSVMPDSIAGVLWVILYSAVLPGICEELLFRGALLSAWEEKGSLCAMLVTGVCFMCIHGNVWGAPVELLAGLVLAFLVIAADSLFAGMLCHMIYNTAVTVLQYCVQQGAIGAEMSIYTALFILLGGLVLLGVTLYIVYRRGIQPFGVARPPRAAAKRQIGGTELCVTLCSAISFVCVYALELLELLGVKY